MSKAQYYEGDVFVGESATLLARMTDRAGAVVQIADIASITYTISAIDYNTEIEGDVEGHTDAPLEPSAVLFDTLQLGAIWTQDQVGFNFMHVIDVGTHEAFAATGYYLVEYRLIPVVGQPLPLRFKVKAI